MKRNYLLIVAILFVSSMTLLFASTHALEERPTRTVFCEPQAEWVLPKNPILSQPLERIYRRILHQFAP